MSSLTGARMSYAAALVASVTFGLYLSIALLTAYKVFVSQSRHRIGKKVLLSWIAAVFVLQTVYYCAGSKWSEIEFVESTENPGVFAGQLSSRLAVLKDTAYIVTLFFADGFVLYRAITIYADKLYIAALPVLLYLATLATGIGFLIETAKPGSAFGQASIIDFGTPFWSLSVSTNVLSTLLIAARLATRRRVLDAPGVAIFLESAALYAVCAIMYIPMFALDIPLQFPFSALLVSAASIAPHLIILRMVSGQSARVEQSLIPLQSRRGDTEAGISTRGKSMDGGSSIGKD